MDVPHSFHNGLSKELAGQKKTEVRHAIVNFFSYIGRHPLFFLYQTIIVYALTPLRLFWAVKAPIVIPIVLVLYWVLLFIFGGGIEINTSGFSLSMRLFRS